MYRTPLKSRTGCERCRIRRKKCDEQKPVCTSCSRLGLSCTWPTPQKRVVAVDDRIALEKTSNDLQPLVEVKRVPRARCPPLGSSHTLGPGYKQFRDQVQFDLTFRSLAALRGLVSRSAAPEYLDTTILMPLALKHDWLRDSLAAFAAFSFLAVHRDSAVWERMAIHTYHNGLWNLRSHLSKLYEGGVGAESLEVLLAVTFLGLSESLGTGDVAPAVTHFTTAASICRKLSLNSIETRAEALLYRIAVECWLYNLATLSLFSRDVNSIILSIDWAVLEACFEGSVSANAIALQHSPFIGGSHGIYRLILQLTCFARQDAPLMVRQNRTTIWSAELDVLQDRLNTYRDLLPPETARLYQAKFLLHVYALRIYLMKVADHTSSAASPIIHNYILAAQRIFQSNPTSEGRNPALAWPLTIFLCGASDEQTFGFFLSMIGEIRDNFDPGHTRRITAALDAIQIERQRTAGLYEEGQGSGLGLLLRKNGILIPDVDVTYTSTQVGQVEQLDAVIDG